MKVGRILKNLISGRRRERYEQLFISNERYRFIAEQSESAVIEMDIGSGRVFCSENYRKIFLEEPDCEHFTAYLLESGRMPAADRQRLLDAVNACRRTRLFQKLELRVRTGAGNLIWCKVGLGVICDSAGKPVKLLAKVTDIDSLKREQERLIRQSRVDPFTQVYNKVYAERAIERELQAADGRTACALVLLDLDDFKCINDRWGHTYGDVVLLHLVRNLRENFPGTVIGRMGGDEFAVFVRECEDGRLQALLEGIQTRLRGLPGEPCLCKGLSVSVSMGVARYPRDADNFGDLYRKADLALYDAKSRGKNRYAFFDPSREPGPGFSLTAGEGSPLSSLPGPKRE